MSVSRRTFVKAGAVTALAAGTRISAAKPAVVTVYDSRIPASRAFARRVNGTIIDVATEDAAFWTNLRAVPAGRIVGLIGWSDWVVVRGLLEDQGKRVLSEAAAGRHFRWEMV